MTGGRAGDRPRTPDYIRKFAHDLYDERCLRCGICRPLAVAHIDPWPVVRQAILDFGGSVEAYGWWTFHQPNNVVLLCCNCHALVDDPKVLDVTLPQILELRDQKLRDRSFVEKIRHFILREIGDTPRRPVAPATLEPLERWLRDAALNGTLPPPHRFYARWRDSWMLVDLIEMDIEFDREGEQLPKWDGARFLPTAGPGTPHVPSR